jgi:type I restriction enzyme S subunit
LTADNAEGADTEKSPRLRLPLSAPSALSAVKNSEPEIERKLLALPRGWSEVALRDLGLGRTEGVEPADEPTTLFELWSVPNFPTGKPERVLGSTIGSNKQRVAEGDVLLCKINPRINRVWVVGPSYGLPQIASTEWIVFRSAAFYPRFLMWRFRENRFRGALCANMTGVGGSLTRARPKDVAEIKIVLPPLAEQRRIVARLEALEARSGRARALLAEVPAQLAQARQSLLAAAFRGDLTANWRERHPETLPADVSLRDHALKTAGRMRNVRRLNPAIGLTLLDFSDALPVSWLWQKVRELVGKGAIIDVQDGNHGELYPRAEDFGEPGVPYISAENVAHGIVDIASAPRLKQEKAQQLRIGFAKANDVILTHNASVGRVALLPLGSPDVILSTSTTYYRVDEEALASRFLAAFLSSHYFQVQLEAVMAQTTRNQVSVTKQVEFGIAVPPLPEQHEIVRRLSAALARLDAAARAHAAAVAELDRLDQSLLARAFSGTLVAQDPTDTPAAAILARQPTICDKQLGLAKARP